MTTNEPISGDELDTIAIAVCALSGATSRDLPRWKRNDDGSIDYEFKFSNRDGDRSVVLSHEFLVDQGHERVITYMARKVS